MLLAFSVKIEMYVHLDKSSTPIIVHIYFRGDLKAIFEETKAKDMPIDINYIYKYIKLCHLWNFG